MSKNTKDNNTLANTSDITTSLVKPNERQTFYYTPKFTDEEQEDKLFNVISNPKAGGAIPLKDMINRKMKLSTFFTEPRLIADKDQQTNEPIIKEVVNPETGEVEQTPVMKHTNYLILFGFDEKGKEVITYSSSTTFYLAFIKALNFYGERLFNGEKAIEIKQTTQDKKQYYSFNVCKIEQ